MLLQISSRKSLQIKLSRDGIPRLVVGLPDVDLHAERFEGEPLLLIGQLSQSHRDALAPVLEIDEPALPLFPAGAAREHRDALDFQGALLGA